MVKTVRPAPNPDGDLVQVGKRYATRDGLGVGTVTHDAGEPIKYRIKGTLEHKIYKRGPQVWRHDGMYFDDGRPSDLDLVRELPDEFRPIFDLRRDLPGNEAAPDVVDGLPIAADIVCDLRTRQFGERRYVVVTTPGSAPDHFMSAFLAMGPHRWRTPSDQGGTT